MRAFVGGIDLLEVVAGRRIDLTARNRIARHAATEIVDTAGDFFFVALAEEVDRRDDQPFAALVHLLVAAAGDEPVMRQKSGGEGKSGSVRVEFEGRVEM